MSAEILVMIHEALADDLIFSVSLLYHSGCLKLCQKKKIFTKKKKIKKIKIPILKKKKKKKKKLLLANYRPVSVRLSRIHDFVNLSMDILAHQSDGGALDVLEHAYQDFS